MNKLSCLIEGVMVLILLSIAPTLTSQTPVDISLEIPFDDSATIRFIEGDSDYGMLMRYNGNNDVNGLQIIPITPDNPENRPSLIVDRQQGWVSVGRQGSGNKLLVLNSERSWAFSQFGTGGSTALKLSATNSNNNNKNFIIDTDGFVGIRDDAPVHQLSLGSGLARTKLALYESPTNTSNYGMGVQSGRFHFNLGNSSARYQFNDGPGSGASPIFTIEGSGNIIAPGLEGFGAGAPMIYDPGGEIGFDNSSRRFKTDIRTMGEDWTKIFQTRPVTYTRPASRDTWEIGYIAEELDSIGLGNLVGYDLEGLPFYIRYDRVALYLAEIVKMHHADLQAKQEQIDKLVEKIATMDDLRTEVNALRESIFAREEQLGGQK